MTATQWFFGLIGITVFLFLIAYFLPEKHSTSSQKPLQKTQNNLNELLQLTHGLLDETYIVELSERYISITKNNQKIALLTLDNKLANGIRKMGNTLIINFNKLPSKQSLLATLKAQGILHYN